MVPSSEHSHVLQASWGDGTVLPGFLHLVIGITKITNKIVECA